MRIAIVSSMYPPIQSGSSYYAHRIVKGLAERGHEVILVSSRFAGARSGANLTYRLPSIMIPRTPITHGYKLPYSFYPLSYHIISSILKRHSPDVIHANGHFMDASMTASSCAKRLRIPIVLTVHTRLVHTNTLLNALMRYTDRSVLSRIWSRANAVIALDRQMYRYITKELGVTKSSVSLIPLAMDIEKFLSYPIMHLDYPCFSNGMRSILSISHLTDLKSATTILNAFKQVAMAIDDVQLVFAGKVCTMEPIRLTRKLGLESRVHFLNEVEHGIIPSLLSKSVLEVHSLDNRTGFDNASIEAMAMGVPVISCVREDNFGKQWLSNRNNVLLVPPRNVEETVDAMKLVLDNPSFADRISKNSARAAVTHFSLHRFLNDLERLYESVSKS